MTCYLLHRHDWLVVSCCHRVKCFFLTKVDIHVDCWLLTVLVLNGSLFCNNSSLVSHCDRSKIVIALYRSASLFERCLQSRTSLLSSAMALVSNSCTARGGIEHYGNWVCRPTTSLRERCEHTHEVGKMSANN